MIWKACPHPNNNGLSLKFYRRCLVERNMISLKKNIIKGYFPFLQDRKELPSWCPVMADPGCLKMLFQLTPKTNFTFSKLMQVR